MKHSYYRPYNTEGYPLPTVKEWNSFVREVMESIKEKYDKEIQRLEFLKDKGKIDNYIHLSEPVMMGAVDDLTSASCPRCGEEMIRQLHGHVAVFNVGIVYCDSGTNLEEHPQEYWVEIWPNANIGSESLMHSERRQRKDFYRFSNPVIPRCFSGDDIWWHRHTGLAGTEGDFGLTYYPESRTRTLPKPRYVHK